MHPSPRRSAPTAGRTRRRHPAPRPRPARCSAIDARDATSTLLTTSTVGVSTSCSKPATNRSPRPIGPVASTTMHTTSTPPRVARARSLVRTPSGVRGLWRPGVSRKTIWCESVVRTPRTCVLVVCGRSETIATLLPTSRLTRVDFPTLGRPTTDTKPDRKTNGPGSPVTPEARRALGRRRRWVPADRRRRGGARCGPRRCGGPAPARCATRGSGTGRSPLRPGRDPAG